MIFGQPDPVAPPWKLPAIQIARAVAALSVIYFHSKAVLDRFPKDTAYPVSWLTNYGWVGVDLFFAISGYVICLLVSKAGAGAASIAPSDNIAFRAAVGMGDGSYSPYLLHPLVLLAAKAATIELHYRPAWIEEPIRFGAIAVIIALSLLSWRYFERPAIDLGNRIARHIPLRPKPSSELRC